MRIDRFLSNAGVGTRSEVKTLIKKRCVKVNEVLIGNPAIHIDPNKDKVSVNDAEIKYKQFSYFVLNKPKGYVSANDDDRYPCILEFFVDLNIKNLSHVGRLDLDTTGVILITNDGSLAHKLISPASHVDKIYRVTLDKNIDESAIKACKNGIKLENGEVCRPCELKIISSNICELTLHEGKYHQVKRMMRSLGYTVIDLDRIKFGPLTKKNIGLGNYYELSDKEVESLYNCINKKIND